MMDKSADIRRLKFLPSHRYKPSPCLPTQTCPGGNFRQTIHRAISQALLLIECKKILLLQKIQSGRRTYPQIAVSIYIQGCHGIV